MYTEEDAKTKWCPFARLQGTNCGTYNRPDSNQNCIASECMAWRWDTELNDVLFEDVRARYHEDPEIVEPLKDTRLYRDFLKSRCGFCGLAGKSE